MQVSMNPTLSSSSCFRFYQFVSPVLIKSLALRESLNEKLFKLLPSIFDPGNKR